MDTQKKVLVVALLLILTNLYSVLMTNRSRTDLKILQWNCRALYSNLGDFKFRMYNDNIDVAILCETWLKDSSKVRFNGYQIYRKDRQDGKGGVAIIIKNKFNPIEIDINHNFSKIDVITVECTFNLKTLKIMSIYAAPGHRTKVADYNYLLENSGNNHEYLIVAGDLNGHHSIWGSSKTDFQGRQIVEFTDDNNLILLNNGTNTMVPSPFRQMEPVDITLVSPNISLITEWKVQDNDSMGSDHYPILITIQMNNQIPNPTIQDLSDNEIISTARYYDKADWTKYKAIINREIDIEISQSVEKINHFLIVLNKAADMAIPSKNPTNYKHRPDDKPAISKKLGRKRCPWWSEKCSKAVAERRLALKEFKIKMNQINYKNLKKIELQTKITLNNEKKEGWRSFCKRISKDTPMTTMWNMIKRFKNSLYDSHDNSWLNTMPNWIDEFHQRIAPCSTLPDLEILANINTLPCNHLLLKPLQIEELNLHINNLKNKAPGLDKIHNTLIKNLPEKGKIYLLDIYNNILQDGIVPDVLKTQVILPILKPRKNKEMASSYRPISLTPTIMKIFERMINKRIEWWVENQSILDNQQYGFRKGRSTMDSLNIFLTDIKLAQIKQQSLFATQVDITAAYDNVQILLLIQILENLYINGLKQITSPNVRSLKFADDILVYATHKNEIQAIESMNTELNKINSWLGSKGLDLAPNKCKTIKFSRKRNQTNNYTIAINNVNLEKVNSITFLGITFDKKLNWAEHIDYLTSKTQKGIHIMRALAGVWWGADPECLLLIYNSLIRSQMDYGCSIFANAPINHLKKLDTIQNKALRIALGAMCSTPIEALQNEASIPPLKFRREWLGLKYLTKISSITTNQLLPKIQLLHEKLKKRKNPDSKILGTGLTCLYEVTREFKQNIFTSSKNRYFQNNYKYHMKRINVHLYSGPYSIKTITPQKVVNQQIQEYINKNWPNYIQIYTDGSKMEEADEVGAAVVIPEPMNILKVYKLCKHASIFTAEATAIEKATR